MRSPRLLLMLAFAAVVITPREAWPCKPGHCPVSLLAPADGAEEVPLNARIWVGEREYFDREMMLQSPRLLDMSTGAEVSLKKSELRASQGFVHVFAPETPLAPNTEYRLSGGAQPVLSFRTGRTVDSTPPAPPTVRMEEVVSDWDPPSTCGSSTYGARYALELDGILAVVDVGRSTQVPDELGDAMVSGLEAPAPNEHQVSAFIGSGACRQTHAEPGSETDVRFGTYDIAGNFSGFTDPVPVKIPSGCGCTSGSEAGSVLLLGLAMLRLRKREAH